MSPTFLLLAVAMLGVAAGAGWLAMEGVNRRPVIGAYLAFLWLAVLVLFIDRPEFFYLGLGPINVAVPDVICAFLAVIAALRFVRGYGRVARGIAVPLLIFAGMLALSYVRGLAGFGLQRSTNEFREFFYFLTTLAFVLSFPFDKLGVKLPLAGLVGGGLLVIVAVIRIAMAGGFQFEERPIPSYAALVIGQAFFLGWFWLRDGRRGWVWRWLVFGFLPFCFLMLHRSVWMALAGGLVALAMFDRPGRPALLKTIVIGGALGAGVLALAFGEKVLTGINQAVGEAMSSEQSTLLWRLEGWQALLRPEAGWNVADLAIGRPMGAGYARVLGNSVVNAPEIESGIIPHNYYLSLLLRGGVIGTLAFLTLYFRLIKLLLRRSRHENPTAWSTCFVVILVTQLIYYVPYSADLIQGLLLGGSCALAAAAVPAHENVTK